MHEIDICEGILEAVLRRAHGRPVARIGVRAGPAHHLTAESVRMGFTMVSAGGPAESAEVQLTALPARLRCAACGAESEVTDLYSTCPSCRSTDVQVEASDELVLEWIQYRDGPEEGGPDG